MKKEEKSIFGGLQKWSKIDIFGGQNFPQILKIRGFLDARIFKCLKIERVFSAPNFFEILQNVDFFRPNFDQNFANFVNF